MTSITLRAHAKINLTLEVLGRRDDGYHEIATVLQTVDLHDTLTLEPAEAISLECDIPELQSPDNLALKAAHLLKEQAGSVGGARITLGKGIPVSAGLGGGSSDAAATLVGLDRLWGLGLIVEELTPLAAELGSDVPFFLHGGTALALGRGERVQPLPPSDLKWVVLLCPAIPVARKTESLYARVAESDFTRGDLTRKLGARIRGGGDVPPQFLFNAFDELALDVFPGLRGYWDAFQALGAREVHVSGTGPSLYAPVSQKEHGTAIQLMLQHRHQWDSYLVSTWDPQRDGEA